MNRSRREFLGYAGATAAIAAAPSFAVSQQSAMQFGYASITWGKEEVQAIDDIAAAGYAGIQMRNNAVAEFKPDELRSLLKQKKLTFVALSSGELDIDPKVEAEQLALHTANAQFVHQVGGRYLQILDQLKPYPRKVTPDECMRLGKLLTELGKRVADAGVQLGYHNHMNTISEKPDDLARVLHASDPHYVGLELDTAHYVAGGGDAAKAIKTYRDRLLFMHLKDFVDIPIGTENAKYPFKFVELGKGRVDLPAVFTSLWDIRYEGWLIVELDRVPDKSRTPKECAETSKKYLEEKIGVRV